MSSLSKDMLPSYFVKFVITCRDTILCFAISSMKGDFTGKMMLLTEMVRKHGLSICWKWTPIKNKTLGSFPEKELVTMVSNRTFNSNQLRRIANNGFEFIPKTLKTHDQGGYETKALEIEFEELLQKGLECLRLDATVLSRFFGPNLPKTMKGGKDSKRLKPTENQTSQDSNDFDQSTLNQALQKNELSTSKQLGNGVLQNLAQCCLCLEQIQSKKFFDERRFGIMEKCDCMVCYGCVRKFFGITSGAVKGPVECFLCSAKSDKVVASARWIEGKDKIEFFEEYNDNFQRTYKKLNLHWIYLPAKYDNVVASELRKESKGKIWFKEYDLFQGTYNDWTNFPAKKDAINANMPKFVAVN